MGQGRTQRGRRVRAAARSLVVLTSLAAFYAAAAYAHVGHPKNVPAGSLHVSMSGVRGLDAGAADLAAGDVVARTATLQNRGEGMLGAVALAANVTRSSALDRGARAGLRIRVDRCSTAWAPGPDSALHCTGRLTEVIGWRPVGDNRSPWQLGSLPARSAEWLRVAVLLPADSSADLASRRTTIEYRFTAL
jgi:hypothetical protein